MAVRNWLCLVLLMGAMAMAVSARARVYSPWVLSEHVADMRDEVRFAADPRWRELEGQEKALAVWRYLTDRETGTWHYSDMYEGRDPHWESKLVKDPVKILNGYGFGVCTMHACLIEGLYEAMGFGVRQMEFGGYHRTAEVEWGGEWHYLDVDERAYLVDEAGRVVSVTEATTRPELWELSAARVHPFYPQNGGIKGIQELSKHGPPVAHWHWRTLGHTMDFVLRPGESLTRWWRGQGRWRMCEAWLAEGTLKGLLQEPAGPKTSEAISINNTYGNGLWVYEPKLRPEFRDFEEGVYRQENVELGQQGLTVSQEGEGWAEWRVRSPYIIVGRPNDLADPNDDTDGVVAEFRSAGEIGLLVSCDQGRTWEEVWRTRDPGEHRVDLTRWVVGKYEYHVRFVLAGRPGEVKLESLRLSTWTQVAPMSLPRLKAGRNRMRFVMGDRYGWRTEVMAVEPEFSDPADMARWGVVVEGEYHPEDRTARARGPVMLRVEALAGTRLRWLHIGASFNARRETNPGAADRVLYALSPAGPWQVVGEERPPEWNQHWYYNAERDLVLEVPQRELWIRLEPATAANGLRVYAHCEPEGEQEERPAVVVTHAYREGGKLVTRSFELDRPAEYELWCEGEPENVYVMITAPSQPRGR